MSPKIFAALFFVTTLLPAFATAQINFPMNGYYVGLGDSVAAGEGNMPVTGGYVFDLHDRGVFGQKQEMHFANAAVRAARSWELLYHQVPQVLCAEPEQRPTVVTITAGANDFFRGDTNISAIAFRVAAAVNSLLNNDSGLIASPILDPVTGTPCRRLGGVTILVSNYYSIPHPDPIVGPIIDQALRGFDLALRFWLSVVPVPAGSRLALVDLYHPSQGRQGLVAIERRLGYDAPFDFDAHPTNLGHTFISQQFEAVWRSLN